MYENYAKIRDAKGLKDYDVAKATGISPGTLSDWKKGRYSLKYEKLRKIADFLGVTTDELTGVQNLGQQAEYYIDSDAKEMMQDIFSDSDLRALFDVSREIRKQDVKLLLDMAIRLKETNPDG